MRKRRRNCFLSEENEDEEGGFVEVDVHNRLGL
jgi:hypothetical protein